MKRSEFLKSLIATPALLEIAEAVAQPEKSFEWLEKNKPPDWARTWQMVGTGGVVKTGVIMWDEYGKATFIPV